MNYGLIVIFPTLTGEKFRAFDKSVKEFDGVKIPLSWDIFVTFPQKMLWGGGRERSLPGDEISGNYFDGEKFRHPLKIFVTFSRNYFPR